MRLSVSTPAYLRVSCRGQWQGSSRQRCCCQVWSPYFNPQNLNSRRRAVSPISCPLSHILQARTYTQISKANKSGFLTPEQPQIVNTNAGFINFTSINILEQTLALEWRSGCVNRDVQYQSPWPTPIRCQQHPFPSIDKIHPEIAKCSRRQIHLVETDKISNYRTVTNWEIEKGELIPREVLWFSSIMWVLNYIQVPRAWCVFW